MMLLSESEAAQSLVYNVWLQMVLGLGSSKVNDCFRFFGTAKGVFEAFSDERENSGIFSIKELERAQKIKLSSAKDILTDAQKDGIKLIAIDNERYPDRLRYICNPPLVLYYKGVFPDFDNEPTFCIVGPREVSQFGEKSAYSLGYRLAKGGMTIVSGIALGSDTAAHKGALKAKGKTVAVMPCGLSYDYLSVNRPLRQEILNANGCIISECPPQMKVMKYSFHTRNRIMSALSLGVALVEAGEKSGALITARCACEQGRDVFVIPGNPTLSQYKGSNKLLSDGAKPLLDANDIFEEYLHIFKDKIDIEKAFSKEMSKTSKNIVKKSTEGLSKSAQIVYNSLDKIKFTADELLGKNIDDNELLSALTELEISEFIEAVPGGYYRVL